MPKTTLAVGCPPVILTLGSSTDGDFAVFYYTHHIGDYLAHTAHLSLLEHGVYCRLIQVYYLTEKPIPLDEPHRTIGAKTPEEQEAVSQILKEFFQQTPNGWTSKRCEKELLAVKLKSEKASKSAKTRWGMRTHSEGNAIQYPISDNQEPKKILPITNNLDISNIAIHSQSERNADAMRTHEESVVFSGKPGTEWAYKLKAREEAGEVLSIHNKRLLKEFFKEESKE